MGTLIFQEVSAKTGKDINLLFTTHIYEQIAEKYKLKPNLKEQQKLSIPNQNEETSENIKNSNKKDKKRPKKPTANNQRMDNVLKAISNAEKKVQEKVNANKTKTNTIN